MEHLLDALYNLVLLEHERRLTVEEEEFYIYCVDTLRDNKIEIPFGISF